MLASLPLDCQADCRTLPCFGEGCPMQSTMTGCVLGTSSLKLKHAVLSFCVTKDIAHEGHTRTVSLSMYCSLAGAT